MSHEVLPITFPEISDGETAVLVDTDIIRDPDDGEAKVFLNGAEHAKRGVRRVRNVGATTTSWIPLERACANHLLDESLGQGHLPTGLGAVYALGKEGNKAELDAYKAEHSINGESYEGKGILPEGFNPETDAPQFPQAVDVIVGAIQKYGKSLKILAIGPLTNLALAERAHPGILAQSGGIVIQGQATESNGRLVPDMQAYNLSTDPVAAREIFDLQDVLDFTLLGKPAARIKALGLTRQDFRDLASTGHPAGKYLETHASLSIECFAKQRPGFFQTVYEVDPDKVGELKTISNPYDLLAAMTITNPDLFTRYQVGRHALIGRNNEDTGVPDPERVKNHYMNTMLRALCKGSPVRYHAIRARRALRARLHNAGK